MISLSGLYRPGLGWLVLGGTLAGCAPPPTPPPPNIILISLDTTRTDHLGAYGSPVQTPAIDAVAGEGIVFEQVSAACTTTLPSHVSLFTGEWPHRHGVARNGFTVSEANRMLPEILREAGYRTWGVSAAVALSELLNFPQGFEQWDQDPETALGYQAANEAARTATEITDAAIAALEELQGDPFFLFVHYVDPHAPYDPPEPYRSLYGEVPAAVDGSYPSLQRSRQHHAELAQRRAPTSPGRALRPHDLLASGVPLGSDEALAHLYAGEVTYMDHEVGRLLAALRSSSCYDDAILLITADHGETFWEHADLWSHGAAAYETTVSVPLILRLPEARHAGARVAALVSNVDVLPTLQELLGLPVGEQLPGQSLLRHLDGTSPPGPRPVFSQGPLPGGPQEDNPRRWINERKTHSIREGTWKYIRTPYLQFEELYDLARDPGEQRNLLQGLSPAAEPIRRRLADLLDAWLASADPRPSEFYPRQDAGEGEDAAERHAMWERLKAMGYVEEE